MLAFGRPLETDDPSNKTGRDQLGCAYFGLLSVVASALGSVLAAAIFSAEFVFSASHSAARFSRWEALGEFPFIFGMVFFFGAALAIPIGLIMGLPMLAICRSVISRVPVASTLAFAVIGLLGGFAIQQFGGSAGLDNAELVFGACVGGMHPLVYCRAKGLTWSRLSVAFLLAAAFVPALAFAGEDFENLNKSRDEFDKRCADRYGSMVFVADRKAIEQVKSPVPIDGKWLNQRKWLSLYAREKQYPINADQVLLARDYAYVPSGVAGWITGGRRVERHCFSEKSGRSFQALRERGFGKRPTLGDLTD
jgi:hypothetical protein